MTPHDWGGRPRGTIGALLERNASVRPDKVGFYCDDEPISYGELYRRSLAWANRYRELGIGRGDRVAVFMENCPEIVCSWFACALLGAIHVPVNIALSGDFLTHQLQVTDPAAIVADTKLVDGLLGALPAGGDLRHLVVRGEPVDGERLLGIEQFSTDELDTGAAEPLSGPPPEWDDLVTILFTSGTTGRSKGVTISHNYFVHMARTIVDTYRFDEDSTWYQPSPLFHVNASLTAVLVPALTGGTGCTDRRFSAGHYWDRVRHYGATHIALLAYAPLLWNQPERPDDQDHFVRVAAGSAVPPEIHEGFERRFGLRIVKGYALSEVTSTPIMSTLEHPAPPQFAGAANPDYDVRIFTDADEEAPDGDVGEIVIRPRAPGIMFSGYYNDERATVEVWRNGWFHTGDLGRKTGDGWFSFVDRKKDYIRRRGENISSYELEATLVQHPAVAQVAVHGVPSAVGEEDVKACLVGEPGAVIDMDEFIEFCRRRLPKYAVPRYVEVLTELPRNQVGRVLKTELRLAGITDRTWDREATS